MALDGPTITGVAVALLTGGSIQAYLGYKKDKRLAPTPSELRQDASVVLMQKTYGTTIETLQEQMHEMQERHEQEMLAQATRHSKERAEWLEDRERFKQTINELRNDLESVSRRLTETQRKLEGS